MQEQKVRGYEHLEKHALNMLIAGPALWLLGSIHNACQIYERADGHVQVLQQSVHTPFLMGSLLFMIGAILDRREHGRSTGVPLLVMTNQSQIRYFLSKKQINRVQNILSATSNCSKYSSNSVMAWIFVYAGLELDMVWYIRKLIAFYWGNS